MTRSLNIPRTDELVWNSVVHVLSNSEILKERAWRKLGGAENIAAEVRKGKQDQRRLTKRLEKLEAALARSQTDFLLEDVDPESYQRIRENLDSEKRAVLDRLDTSRALMRELENQEKWLDGIDRFFEALEKMEAKTDAQKKRFLEIFVDRIDVSYDQTAKEHSLLIKFKLPIVGDDILGEDGVIPGAFGKQVILPPNKTTLQ